MKNDIVRQWINLIALAVVIIMNGLANALPLNDLTTGEISDRFQVYFVPAGYVFSIWGLIYLALLGFIIYQLLPSQRQNPRLQHVGYWFALSCVANTAWLLLWHYELFALTLLAMVILLICLIIIYLRLDIGRIRTSIAERLLVDAPFSIYLGWITVATIANVTSLLDYLRWDGLGIAPEIWALIMLIAGVIISFAMSLTRGDVAYLLVIIWAYVGIAIKHAGTSLVSTTAWVGTGLVGVALIIAVFRMRFLLAQKTST